MEAMTLKAKGFPDLLGQISSAIHQADDKRRIDHAASAMDFIGSALCAAGIAHIQAKDDLQRIAPDMEFLEPNEVANGN